MTFTWTTIHVRDLDQSLAFYHDLLGLPIQERFGPPGHEIAMLGPEEGTRLELIGGGEIPEHPAPTLSLGFAPENMGQLLAALEARAIPIRPMSPNPALQFYFLEDPDGYTVQLVEILRQTHFLMLTLSLIQTVIQKQTHFLMLTRN